MEDPVASYKKSAIDGMEMFLRNFAHIPDDKLNWTPTPTAKSAIRVAAHTALYAGRFAAMIRDRKLPNVENIEAWLAERNAEEITITDRKEMEIVFRKGTDEVLAALDSLSQEEIAMTLVWAWLYHVNEMVDGTGGVACHASLWSDRLPADLLG